LNPKKKAFDEPVASRKHMVAASGDLEELKMSPPKIQNLHAGDSNGWKPIHEAARSGRTNI
jgi:hypothetical protein